MSLILLPLNVAKDAVLVDINNQPLVSIDDSTPINVQTQDPVQVNIADPTTPTQIQTVNSDGNANVVQHSHVDSVYAHCDVAVTGGTDQDIILVDLSDTTGYPHANTGYIHLEELYIEIDAETNASYLVSIGFLANVDATDGDFYELTHVQGTKTVGQQKEVVRKFYPNGPKCQSGLVITSDITLNDTTFQTDVNLPSIWDPTTSDTPSGSGDLVLRIDAGAGGANTDFNVEVNFSYHTHA